jgi:hypothetical protein
VLNGIDDNAVRIRGQMTDLLNRIEVTGFKTLRLCLIVESCAKVEYYANTAGGMFVIIKIIVEDEETETALLRNVLMAVPNKWCATLYLGAGPGLLDSGECGGNLRIADERTK